MFAIIIQLWKSYLMVVYSQNHVLEPKQIVKWFWEVVRPLQSDSLWSEIIFDVSWRYNKVSKWLQTVVRQLWSNFTWSEVILDVSKRWLIKTVWLKGFSWAWREYCYRTYWIGKKVFSFVAFKKLLDVLINLIIYSKLYMGINKILIFSFIKHKMSKAGNWLNKDNSEHMIIITLYDLYQTWWSM